MVGEELSHYRIVEKLGEGGMGVVYRAHDLKLDRDVALKFLPSRYPPSSVEAERFAREAKAISTLADPHIATIHDIDEVDGQQFLVLEYLPGGTLKQKLAKLRVAGDSLPVRDVIAFGLQIAEGLSHAHRRGIVHRDVKSDNIMLTESGQLKITDFGLAALRDDEEAATAEGPAGTAAYMSPEQIRGEHVGIATDIWGFGIVLYEMLAGRLPFEGEYGPAVMYSIVNQRHPPLRALRADVPVGLELVVDRCLEKAPSARYGEMAAVVTELQQVRNELAGTPRRDATSGKSVAVLPFSDISPEMDNKYFSDGLTEEIIASLSKLRGLKVKSRTSVMNYHRADKTLKDIAAELGVQYVLEGSVRKHGSDLRITTELIDAEKDASVWAEKYRGKLDQIFDIQEEVAEKIVDALRVQLTPDEKQNLKKRFTANAEAYQLYLKGRYFWSKRSHEGFTTAIRYFEQAIEKDPQYALAWVGLADAWNLLSDGGKVPRKVTFTKAKDAVTRALDIDGSLADAHASLGIMLMLNDQDWKGSDREFRRAIELDPNYATGHHWYAEWLSYNGRHDDALREIAIAGDLDPVSPAIMRDRGMLLYYARRYDESVDACWKALELDPSFGSVHRILSLAFEAKGAFDRAVEENRLWGTHIGNTLEVHAALAHILGAAGREKDAVEALAAPLREPNPGGNLLRGIGLACVALGRHDDALMYLERAFEIGAVSLSSIKVDPKLDPIRAHPRFIALLKKTGLEP